MDDAPALVLVPPSPFKFDSQSSTPSKFPVGPQRPSSATTIVSIYSMYGDDPSHPNWPPSTVVANGDRRMNELPALPTAKIKTPDNHRCSVINGHLESELAYYDDHDDVRTTQNNSTSMNNAPARASSSHSPSSAHAFAVTNDDYSRSLRTSTASSYRSRSRESIHVSAHSRQSSRSTRNSPGPHPRSASIDHDLLNLPPLPPSIPPSRHATPTPMPTPPRHPSPSLHPPMTPKSLPLKHSGSPSSKVSLVPSEGEDLDAFHVRNTYAELEVSGVRGDGYEDGVERTRARIGTNRASQLNAEAALGDGTEKSRELDIKEIHTLASVDRYGFYAMPSHDRLVLLSSAPLQKRLAPVSAGSASAPTSAMALRGLPPVGPQPKELSRILKWTRMLKPFSRDAGANVALWTIKPSKGGKLRRRVYKGIPDPWRSAAWSLLMTRSSRNLMQYGGDYRDALDKPSTYDIQIDLDVPRTISGHIMFRTRYGAGQRSLFHVLHCFSLRCPKCGYVQGMGPIAATLLRYFEPERVYAALVLLHDHYTLHAVFSPGFPGLLEAIYIQERITQTKMPAVYEAFKKHMVSTSSYATKWYITLFSNSVPFQTQLRIWDAFLLDGYDVFVAMAVAIVWVYRDQITSASANFETILSLLSSFFVPEDEDVLMSWISRMLEEKKLRTSIVSWKQDWRTLVATGRDGAALI